MTEGIHGPNGNSTGSDGAELKQHGTVLTLFGRGNRVSGGTRSSAAGGLDLLGRSDTERLLGNCGRWWSGLRGRHRLRRFRQLRLRIGSLLRRGLVTARSERARRRIDLYSTLRRLLCDAHGGRNKERHHQQHRLKARVSRFSLHEFPLRARHQRLPWHLAYFELPATFPARAGFIPPSNVGAESERELLRSTRPTSASRS